MRVKTDEKRQVIIEAAVKVFKKEGYERASMASIARRVGGSKATLYSYFKSKEELFEAAMKTTVEGAAERILPLLDVESEDVQGVLERFAEAYVAFVVSDEILPITRAIVSEGFTQELGAALYDQGPRRGIHLMAEFLAEEMRRGRMRSTDPITAALHLKGLIESDHFEAALYGAKPTRERKAAITDAIDVFLAAYRPIGQLG
jgi:AcrR family transcriptional regulator